MTIQMIVAVMIAPIKRTEDDELQKDEEEHQSPLAPPPPEVPLWIGPKSRGGYAIGSRGAKREEMECQWEGRSRHFKGQRRSEGWPSAR